MRQSKLFGRTLREAPAEAQTPGHRLMLRAAIARPLAAGLYTWLPLGFRVQKKVEQIIREEQDRIGAQEMEMPVLTPAETWKQTDRWDMLEPITFRTSDHNGREFMISYTHEEFVHLHAMQEIQSYKQLPQIVYHFQSKGRDEARPRAGLLRVREFVMKDAYSFDADQAGLEKSYAAEYGAYERTFKRMGLDAISVESDTGAMGGDVAHEFQVLTEVGEDRIAICSNCDYRANMRDAHLRDVVLGRDFQGERVDASDVREGDVCPKCKVGKLTIKRGVEVGNIFAYGTYYSEKMRATFVAEDGTQKPFVGGSYGIGIGRAVQTIIETHHDDKGIVWPPQVAPYQVHVIALPVNDDEVRAKAEALVAELEKRNIEVLYDDRDETAGVKFADADLIGIPLRVTVSKRNLKENAAELKLRSASESEMVPLDNAAERIAGLVSSWP